MAESLTINVTLNDKNITCTVSNTAFSLTGNKMKDTDAVNQLFSTLLENSDSKRYYNILTKRDALLTPNKITSNAMTLDDIMIALTDKDEQNKEKIKSFNQKVAEKLLDWGIANWDKTKEVTAAGQASFRSFSNSKLPATYYINGKIINNIDGLNNINAETDPTKVTLTPTVLTELKTFFSDTPPLSASTVYFTNIPADMSTPKFLEEIFTPTFIKRFMGTILTGSMANWAKQVLEASDLNSLLLAPPKMLTGGESNNKTAKIYK